MNAHDSLPTMQETTAEIETTWSVDPDLSHFLDLCLAGRHRGASSGAVAARTLALAMLDEGLGLDGSAVEGFKLFLDLAKQAPETARNVIAG